MKRREFLMAGLAGATSPMILAKSNKLRNNKNNPVSGDNIRKRLESQKKRKK